jgi:regulator of protease activity HflC (stomatin/prohibitin superfamily)
MTQDRPVRLLSGWPVVALLVVAVLLLVGGVGGMVWRLSQIRFMGEPAISAVVGSVIGLILDIVVITLLSKSLFTLEPNEAAVLLLFGSYKGTCSEQGLWATNPFNTVRKVSLRARNMEGNRLKVNDRLGNPIEIAAVIVWHVQDAAQATFDVDDFVNYVKVQSESAVRHLASRFSYDHGEENEVTLRSGLDEVSRVLAKELEERLVKAGVAVHEARLTHLAYAPEIAQAMLRRQQAEAVIAARQKIVHGAVSMVEMALRELSERNVVELDPERKAAMVSNLLVVLCGESEAHPVINTGTLYN